jgi:hypothetical protein
MCGLFADNAASKSKVADIFERICKEEAVVAYSKMLFLYLNRGTDENHEEPGENIRCPDDIRTKYH